MEFVFLTEDGAVSKKVVEPGQGDRPPKHARCVVHYVGRLAESGTEFMNTKQENPSGEPAILVAGRDTVKTQVGLNVAVAHMQLGETALVRVGWEYGYGAQGNFSFPQVPPKCDLEYDVTLIDFTPADEAEDPSGLLFEERLERAERLRLEGNDLYKAGKAQLAEGKYMSAMTFVPEDLLLQVEGFHLEKLLEIKLPLHLNLAACQLQREDADAAIENCNFVIGQDRTNAKAWFRRAKAKRALGRTGDALEDIMAAAKLAPDDRGIQVELQALRQLRLKEQQAADRMFKGRLNQTGVRLTDEAEEQQPDVSEEHMQKDDMPVDNVWRHFLHLIWLAFHMLTLQVLSLVERFKGKAKTQ